MDSELSGAEILAAASSILEESGYFRASTGSDMPDSAFRVFEDTLGVVAIRVFDSWTALREDWTSAQGALVDLISSTFSRPEPKAWEGYLVLLTTEHVAQNEAAAISAIRNDTNRVRKIVATGDDLTELAGVRSALLPLLPLDVDVPPVEEAGILGRLPEILERNSAIPMGVTLTVMAAFEENASILERLHHYRVSP